jgi:hypothetical protein
LKWGICSGPAWGRDKEKALSEEHRNKIGIAAGNTLKSTGTKSEQRKGRDTDIYFYDELNEAGDLVAKYEVRESMSIYPPFTNTVTAEKVS